ncbi:unnamed protein product [Schistocephalus solidus]|uniref:C2H2-type domain-containing protein n=1 Tax=Schistocephalus solidus TaxID=70667 RepID=A0A3P7C031_SCHSO|nr:unnamed protein product [Schistocephalus solidus]
MLFEVEDLAVASPATVSRAGMVYNDVQELGWWPYVNCWIATKTGKVVIDTLKMLFNKDLTKILEFVQRSCNKLIPVSEISLIIGLCRLFDGLFGDGSEFDNSDADNFARVIEMLFQFSLLWSVCCVVDEDGRKKVDSFVRELDGSFPNKDSIYEYFVDPKTRTWIHWEEKLRAGWKYQPSMPFFKILVPTVDTVRYKFLVNTLVAKFCPVLITGPVGTGKTSVAQDVLFSLDREAWSFLTINMSAQVCDLFALPIYLVSHQTSFTIPASISTEMAPMQTIMAQPSNVNLTTTNTSDVNSALNCLHCNCIFTSRIGVVGHLRIFHTETGKPVHGAPICSRRARLRCPR